MFSLLLRYVKKKNPKKNQKTGNVGQRNLKPLEQKKTKTKKKTCKTAQVTHGQSQQPEAQLSVAGGCIQRQDTSITIISSTHAAPTMIFINY